MQTKQVIVLRKFPGLRTGKYCSQASHASMSFLTKGGSIYQTDLESYPAFHNDSLSPGFREEVESWLRNSFTKICVYVNSEEELIQVHQAALDVGLESHLVEDNGATEFKGVKTKTCCAIGPHFSEKFVGITDHLPLL